MVHPVWIGYHYFGRATALGHVLRTVFWAVYASLSDYLFASYPLIRLLALSIPLSLVVFYFTLTLLVLPLIEDYLRRYGLGSASGRVITIRHSIRECADRCAWLLLVTPLHFWHPVLRILHALLFDVLLNPAVNPAAGIAFWLYNTWLELVENMEEIARFLIEDDEQEQDFLLRGMFPVFIFSSA